MTALRRGRAKEVARASANREARDDRVRVMRNVGASERRVAALVRVRVASAAIDLVTAGTADREASPVTATRVSDARAAMTIGREGVQDSVTVTKGVFPGPRVSGKSGASVASESGTPGVRDAKSRDGF